MRKSLFIWLGVLQAFIGVGAVAGGLLTAWGDAGYDIRVVGGSWGSILVLCPPPPGSCISPKGHQSFAAGRHCRLWPVIIVHLTR